MTESRMLALSRTSSPALFRIRAVAEEALERDPRVHFRWQWLHGRAPRAHLRLVDDQVRELADPVRVVVGPTGANNLRRLVGSGPQKFIAVRWNASAMRRWRTRRPGTSPRLCLDSVGLADL